MNFGIINVMNRVSKGEPYRAIIYYKNGSCGVLKLWYVVTNLVNYAAWVHGGVPTQTYIPCWRSRSKDVFLVIRVTCWLERHWRKQSIHRDTQGRPHRGATNARVCVGQLHGQREHLDFEFLAVAGDFGQVSRISGILVQVWSSHVGAVVDFHQGRSGAMDMPGAWESSQRLAHRRSH